MSAKDLISPYLNRLVAINKQKATAKLELCCKDGKVVVNFQHDLGLIEETSPIPQSELPAYSDILKKGVSTSQLNRLQRRAEERAEKSRSETKIQQNIAENAKIEAERAFADAEKATIEAKKAIDAAEEAKVILLKTQKDSEDIIAQCKKEAEEAEYNSLKHKKSAEKAKEATKLVNILVTKPNNPEISEDEFDCEYCPEEFTNKKLYEEHIGFCPICKINFKEPPYCQSCHIRYSHEEFMCGNCGKYFSTLSNINEHKTKCHGCDNCDKYFKSIGQLRKHSRKCVPIQDESTDESESSN